MKRKQREALKAARVLRHEREKTSIRTQKINDSLLAHQGDLTPIVYNGKEYFNRRQLLFLGISPEDYDTYFRLTALKVIANGDNINLLTLVSDYKDYVRFSDINARFFLSKK